MDGHGPGPTPSSPSSEVPLLAVKWGPPHAVGLCRPMQSWGCAPLGRLGSGFPTCSCGTERTRLCQGPETPGSGAVRQAPWRGAVLPADQLSGLLSCGSCLRPALRARQLGAAIPAPRAPVQRANPRRRGPGVPGSPLHFARGAAGRSHPQPCRPRPQPPGELNPVCVGQRAGAAALRAGGRPSRFSTLASGQTCRAVPTRQRPQPSRGRPATPCGRPARRRAPEVPPSRALWSLQHFGQRTS